MLASLFLGATFVNAMIAAWPWSDNAYLLRDVTPPDVMIIGPANGTAINDLARIDVEATDTNDIKYVVLYANDLTLATDADGTDGWAFAWLTINHPNGDYTLTAEAFDLYGNRGRSEPVTVIVNNQ